MQTPVHLHTPTSGAVCGATVADRKAELTALRSEVTCPLCLGTLRPSEDPVRRIQELVLTDGDDTAQVEAERMLRDRVLTPSQYVWLAGWNERRRRFQ